MLKKGDRGELVKAVQTLFNLLGYHLYPDGIFGEKTENVVKDFQRKMKIKVDGIVGNETLSFLLLCSVNYARRKVNELVSNLTILDKSLAQILLNLEKKGG